MDMVKKFYEEEDGMGVIEIVMIIGALMCIALLFKDAITEFVTQLLKNTFKL